MTLISNEYAKTVTSDGSAFTIEDLAFFPSYVRVTNLSVRASPGSSAAVAVAELYPRSLSPTTTITTSVTSSATTSGSVTSNGIEVVDYSGNPFGARQTLTSITAANPAVVTAASHNLATGDRVLINSATGMTQIVGMIFHVTNVTSSTFQLTRLNASGFASAASAGSFQKVNLPALWRPEGVDVTNVSKAANAVVTMASQATFEVGQKISFYGFDVFGMTELENMTATITAVSTSANTLTTDLDTRNFSTFAFPVSGGTNYNRPHIVPYGIEARYLNDGVGSSQSQSSERSIDLRIGSAVAGSSNNILEVYANNTIQYDV